MNLVHQWVHKFAYTTMPHVLEVALGNNIDYESICQLVEKIESDGVSWHLASPGQDSEATSPGLPFQKALVKMLKAISMCFSHLPFKPYRRKHASDPETEHRLVR